MSELKAFFTNFKNTGRNVERLLTKTVIGFVTRIIAKVSAHLLKYPLRLQYGIDIQTFQWSTDLAF